LKENLIAHYHSRALWILDTRIQTFNNFLDNLYDEKLSRLRIIEVLKKSIETKSVDYIKAHHLQYMQQVEDELTKLNQIPKQSTSLPTVNTLDKTLKRLLENEMRSFTLVLKRSDRFEFRFSYPKKVLRVVIPYIKQQIKQGILYEHKLKSLTSLGFNFNDSETNLILTLRGKKDEILIRLKTILSNSFLKLST